MNTFHTRLPILTILATTVLLGTLALQGQTLTTSIPIGPQPGLFSPTQMIVNPANHKVYVAGQFGTIAVVDGTTNQTLTHIKNTNGGLYGMILSASANQIYLLGGNIQVIDSATDTIVKTFTPSPIAGAVTTGIGAPLYAEGGYNPVTNRLYIMEPYETDNLRHVRLIAIDGASGAELAVIATDNTLAPFIGASVVNPANNKIYGIGSGGLNTVGGWEVYDGTTNTRLAGTLFAPPEATDYTNGYLSGYQVNPADNSLWMTTWLQTCQIAADGHTTVCTPPLTRFYRVDGVTNQLTSHDAFGFFVGMSFDTASGRLIGSAYCIPTSTTIPSGLSSSPCANTTLGMAAFDPASPTQIILLNPSIGPANCTVLPRMAAGGFLGGGLLGMDAAAGYFYYANCSPPFSIVITKGVFTGTPTATTPPTLNAIQAVGTLATPDIAGPPENLVIDPSTHRAYVNSSVENYLMAIDPSVPSLTSQFLGNLPASLAVNPMTNTVYVGDAASSTLNVIDGATNTTRPQIQAGAGPNVAVNPVTNRVIVAGPSAPASDPNQVKGAVLLDGTSGALVMTLKAAAAGGMAVNSATNIAYFVNNSQWYAVDLSTGERVFTGSAFGGGAGGGPCQFTGVAVNATTNSYYIAGTCASGPGTMARFDGATNTMLGQVTLAIGRKSGRLAVNPVSNKLYWETDYSTNPATGPGPAINVYDSATLASISAMNGDFFPVAFNTISNLVYTTNGNGLTVWDGVTDAFIGTFGRAGATAQATPAVAVNELTNTIYVTDLSNIGGGEPQGVVDVYHQGPLFHLSGKVLLNGATGLPGAGITINGIRVLTDANGVFQFPARVPPGTYTITPTNPVVCGGQFTCSPASTTVTVINADVSVALTAAPNFTVTGKVVDPSGVGLGRIALTLQGLPAGASPFAGPASSGTSADGTFLFRYLPAANYTIIAQGAPYGFVPQAVSVTTADVSGIVITGTLPIAITSYTLSPFSTIGPGIVTTGTVTLNQPAPLGGITVALSASDPKAAKFPSTVLVPQGQGSVAFTVQGNGVSTASTVTLTASYQGSLAPQGTSSSTSLTVSPGDTLHITSATFSTSQKLITVNATSTNPQAILTVFLASNNQNLGTMVNQGGGNYSFQVPFLSGTPASVNVKSNLGGSTGQGLAIVP